MDKFLIAFVFITIATIICLALTAIITIVLVKLDTKIGRQLLELWTIEDEEAEGVQN